MNENYICYSSEIDFFSSSSSFGSCVWYICRHSHIYCLLFSIAQCVIFVCTGNMVRDQDQEMARTEKRRKLQKATKKEPTTFPSLPLFAEMHDVCVGCCCSMRKHTQLCCSHINSHNQVRGHRTGSRHSRVEEYPRKKKNKPKVVHAYIIAIRASGRKV